MLESAPAAKYHLCGKTEMGIGILAGLTLSGPAVRAATGALTASPSRQTFYVNGQRMEFEAYAIHGNNFVKLRDIGQAVDFGVTYDAATNSVYIDPNVPYQEEVKQAAQATPSSALTKENAQAAIRALRDVYPSGTLYPAPYVPNNPFDRPYDNCDHCAGWAMLCSDAAFGDLPYRRINNPSWEEIRAGDLVQYDGHVVVVLNKTDEYISVTESNISNKVLWGGQYFRWWLEEQPGYALRTRYPQ